jgi:hypothetical protein
VTLTFQGCEQVLKCKSKGLGDGEIQLHGYVSTPGVVKAGETPLKNKIGLTLEGESAFNCGGELVQIQLHGSAIGTITPTNSMATARTWTFVLASKTRQSPEAFEGGGPQRWEWSVNRNPEPVAFSLQLGLTSAEKIEINTVN